MKQSNAIFVKAVLQAGDFITIERWDDGDKSYCGDILEIKAINAPFVVVKNHSATSLNRPTIINVSGVSLMLLTKDFVSEALKKEGKT